MPRERRPSLPARRATIVRRQGWPSARARVRYPRASSLSGPELTLATSGGAEAHPRFFVGGLAEPALAAQALRTRARVVQSRYHVPAGMLQKILILADPVVTNDHSP